MNPLFLPGQEVKNAWGRDKGDGGGVLLLSPKLGRGAGGVSVAGRSPVRAKDSSAKVTCSASPRLNYLRILPLVIAAEAPLGLC